MAMLWSLVCFFLLSCFSCTFAAHVNQRSQQFDDTTSDYSSFSPNEDQISARITICPAKEHFDRCLAHCQKNCTNWNKPVVCPKVCIPGCVCNQGLVRGPNGRCISTRQCQVPKAEESYEPWEARPTKCPAKEQWDECRAHCQRNCNNFDKDFPCTTICVPGCVCKEGLVRGPDRKCISPRQCQIPNEQQLEIDSLVEECPEHQHYSRCGALPICQKNCSNYDKFIPCPLVCYPGCVCDDELVKGPDGNCITPTQCPQTNAMESAQDQFPMPVLCKRDEVFSVCVSSCPDDCENYRDAGRKCNPICLPGCTCKRGTVRGPDGKCIKPEQCPRDKKPEDCTDYEYYDSCGTPCPDDCNNYNHPNRPCDKHCEIGCFCKPGYIRGPKGDCIFPFDCPNQQNDLPFNLLPSEQQQHIAAEPLIQFWDDAEQQTEVTKEESIMKNMAPALEARRQFWDDEELQTEVTKEESIVKNMPTESEDLSRPITCPKHEHYSSCSANKICQKNCTNYDKIIPCPYMCVSGCICDKGLVRTSYPDGPCVRHQTCPKSSEQQLFQRTSSSEKDDDDFLQKRIASSKEVEEPVLRRSPPRRNRQVYAAGCPNVSVCSEECVKEGRRYGICVGPRSRVCVCF